MSPSFAITVDVPASIVRVHMSGFFKAADVARFAVAREAAHRRLRCAAHQHRTLVDIRDIRIQSQDSVDAFAALLSNPAFTSAKIAFVVAVGLAHAQIRRAACHRDARYFACKEEAEAWLNDAVPSPTSLSIVRATGHDNAPPQPAAALPIRGATCELKPLMVCSPLSTASRSALSV